MKITSNVIPMVILVIIFSACDNDDTPKLPPTVSTSPPTNVTATTATVGGDITDNGNDAITKSGIVYSANVSQPTTADNKIESTVTEGIFSIELTGLSSNTTYHVRAFATNSQGTSYGDIVNVATGNAAPIAKDLLIQGTLEVGKTLTASYTYSDPEKDTEGATMFQWYTATSASGAQEAMIDGATSKTFMLQEAQNGKFIRVSITPKAIIGTGTGAEVKSEYSIVAVGAETVTFPYNGEDVTYGIIISPTTQKKWLDRNIGATRLAEGFHDFLAYGDHFQWGRITDGHQLTIRTGETDETVSYTYGTTTTTSDKNSPDAKEFITSSNAFKRDWRFPQENGLWQGVNGVNNPCPQGWRIPTKAEWDAENISNGEDAYLKLKLTSSGYRTYGSGAALFSEVGYYWSSTIDDSQAATRLYSFIVAIEDGQYSTNFFARANGATCRCIKD